MTKNKAINYKSHLLIKKNKNSNKTIKKTTRIQLFRFLKCSMIRLNLLFKNDYIIHV